MIFHHVLSAPATKWAVGGWSFFLAENVILSENRSYLISRFGEENYRIAYGSCSSVAMISIIYGYFYKVKNKGPFRIPAQVPIPASWKLGGFLVQGLGAVLISQSFPKLQIPVHMESSTLQNDAKNTNSSSSPVAPSSGTKEWKVRCPFDFTDGENHEYATDDDECEINEKEAYFPNGVERITRHPGLWSFGLLGFGNAILTPSIPQALSLSMPMLVAYLGGSHQDSRFSRGIGSVGSDHSLSESMRIMKRKLETTSNIPFWALITGKQTQIKQDENSWYMLWDEMKGLNAALALCLVGANIIRRGRGDVIRGTKFIRASKQKPNTQSRRSDNVIVKPAV